MLHTFRNSIIFVHFKSILNVSELETCICNLTLWLMKFIFRAGDEGALLDCVTVSFKECTGWLRRFWPEVKGEEFYSSMCAAEQLCTEFQVSRLLWHFCFGINEYILKPSQVSENEKPLCSHHCQSQGPKAMEVHKNITVPGGDGVLSCAIVDRLAAVFCIFSDSAKKFCFVTWNSPPSTWDHWLHQSDFTVQRF